MTDRQDTESVLKEFVGRRPNLELLCSKTKTLIEEFLEDAGVRYQSVQARVKTEKKLRIKYEDPTKGYKALDEITDQAGLRIITYYEEEVDRVAEVIKREFDVRKDQSIDKRKTESDRFGYYALHFVCLHLKRRIDEVEYKKFAGLHLEIQITPILQHAWAEIEHDWYDLRAAFPENIKRRFSRLSAVLEVVGSEFTEIRKLRENYTKAVELQVETNVDVPLDAISFRSVLAEPWTVKGDNEIAEIRGGTATEPTSETSARFAIGAFKMEGIVTVAQLKATFEKSHKPLVDFVRRYLALAGTTRGKSQRGVCLIYLALMLLARKGEPAFSDALKILGVDGANVGTAAIAEIAKPTS
jgi:putative GTP pyrophosphokinase